MSKEVTRRDNKQPVPARHTAATVVVAIVGVLVAFVVLHAIAGILFFFIKLAVVVALIAGVFWLLGRYRR